MTINTSHDNRRSDAVLDEMHVGDIKGALGTVAVDDQTAGRRGRRLRTMLAILGPGLIVMVGDNDAGAFGTYTEAGQNYGTALLWTLLLLVPVLYVNQEMVLRLGVVTGVGHARLILERFGRFWGAFSVIDLFALNALTLVTEFIGVSLACGALGLPKLPTVLVAAAVTVGAAATGSFRRFERLCLTLVAFSLVIVPIVLMVHPPVAQAARDFVVPQLPGGSGHLADVMLLVIAIVGTTVAPWQLFFQQSYVIDKRITPRFMRYEKADLIIGIVLVVLGASVLMMLTAATFAGRPEAGHFTDAAGVAAGLDTYVSHPASVLFAIGLLDASIIGAAAVGLATAYATADVLSMKHSLHRPVRQAKGFYLCYAGLIGVSTALVLIPGVPLGLLTNGVQTLAGVLLPSASVFLLLLCNDRELLGPWVNGRLLNVFTGAVVWVLVLLSVILTASVLFPDLGGGAIIGILIGGGLAGVLGGVGLLIHARLRPATGSGLTAGRRTALIVLRGYLVVAVVLVVVKLVQMGAGG